ncbi:MAG: NAD(P)H-binding protein, partial [Pseudanabaena sp.]
WKKQAERYLQDSGLTYTIVRPGGLLNREKEGGLVLVGADTLFEGSIPRTKVSQVTVEALFEDNAKNKLVEIVVNADTPDRPIAELFATV